MTKMFQNQTMDENEFWTIISMFNWNRPNKQKICEAAVSTL